MLGQWSPSSYFPLYAVRQAEFVPPMVSAWYLVRLWWTGELYRVQEIVFVAWFVVALAIQLTSRGPWTWMAGMLGQVALAIVLILKKQIEAIY